MRVCRVLGVLFAMSAGACFEDSGMVDDSAGDTMACTPGAESCPCLDGQCVGGLACLSNVCVSPSTTSDATGSRPPPTPSTGPTSMSTTGRPTETAAMDTGTTDTGAMGSGPTDSGGVPRVPCDPLVQNCRMPTQACNVWDGDGFYCGPFGDAEPAQPCEVFSCPLGFVCSDKAFPRCVDTSCCTALCDLSRVGICPAGQVCDPVYLGAESPPGYESVGICSGDAP